MASHASLAQQHCQAWDDTVQHVLLSLQKTIRSVPLSPILVICVRSTGTAVSYLELSLTQTMILVPVPSPTSQPVGCVRVKDAVQVSGVRLMPARQNTGQLRDNAQHGLSCPPRRHLDLCFVDAHALSRLHTMRLDFVADLPFS